MVMQSSREDNFMYAPRVFVSMIAVLLTFAAAVYWMTGSFTSTILQTILCAVILQVGYFVGILYLVRREHLQRQARDQASPQAHRVNDSLRAEDSMVDAPRSLKATEL